MPVRTNPHTSQGRDTRANPGRRFATKYVGQSQPRSDPSSWTTLWASAPSGSEPDSVIIMAVTPLLQTGHRTARRRRREDLVAWETSVYRWSKLRGVDQTKEWLISDFHSRAARDGCELVGKIEFDILAPVEAMNRWLKVRHKAPPPPLADWRFVHARGRIRIRPERALKTPVCPEPQCGSEVKNYAEASESPSTYGWPEQSEIPNWCELRPCGHTVRGRQIELTDRSERGFLVHER